MIDDTFRIAAIMNRDKYNGVLRSRVVAIVTLFLIVLVDTIAAQGYLNNNGICPPQELILPCRCSQKGSEIQIWCSHSDLPRVLNGIKSTSKALNRPIDELILENNFLPSLPGRTFSHLQITRLMLRHNGLERMSAGWLNDMENYLVEIFIVERGLRSFPVDSLLGLRNLEAITVQSESLKRCPEFTGLTKLRYMNVESESLIELPTHIFRNLPSAESITVIGSKGLNRIESGLFVDLPKLKAINLEQNGIEWIHLRAFSSSLPSLQLIDLSHNRINDAVMIGRAVNDIQSLEQLNLDHNSIEVLAEASFVDLPRLKELHLNNNLIRELHHGAFHRVPSLKVVHLENNRLRHVHPESFLMSSGRGLETIHLQNNDISRIEEVRSILDALPTLKYLDLSNNQLAEIPFGSLRGHGTLEQLHLNNNHLRLIERDALMAMPSLRELKLRNNSLTDLLPMPFWNLPALKGLDISFNKFRRLEPTFMRGIPSIRRFDIAENSLSFIDPNVFRNSPMLETVNISANELENIGRGTFEHLNNLYEIDASDNNLSVMITGLPRAIERIILRGNVIKDLSTSTDSIEFPNLRMLDLSSNDLMKVQQVFSRSPQLRVLNLAKNKLTTIEETTFLGLNRLESLNLLENQISSIHELSTAGLSNLRELSLQGNQLQTFSDKILDNTPKIERLDLSRNSITEIMPGSFRKAKSLMYLDISGNELKQLPESLEVLSNMKDIDVSFNKIGYLDPEIMSSWRNLEEFRASNNKLEEMVQGTFKNLPMLQYLDVSSNDIVRIQRGAIRNLPELQEIVLADNRLAELRERSFEDLPNLQAIHLQQNNLRMIAPNTFYNSPSVLYLNLSTNQFRHMENINLKNARNLEVLDLSSNEIRRVASNPLKGLDWLVELKLNDNRICKIQGEPFSSMPRLRVLNLRNNRMGRLHETNFRNLRSNIAILDVDGNPIDCSCEMLWLRAWLQETNSASGPACRDGTMLRDLDLNRQNCNFDTANVPLTNEHGDVFLRHGDVDDCGPLSGENGGYEDFPPNQHYYNQLHRPSPVESDYFYDQYIDYPVNETISNVMNNTLQSQNDSLAPFVDFNQNKFNQNSFPPAPPPAFTFFGRPLPGLGNLWGTGRNANNRAASGEGGTRGKGRVQLYKAGDPDLQVVTTRPSSDLNIDPRNRESASSMKNSVVDQIDQKYYRPFPKFQTSYESPQQSTKPQGVFNPPKTHSGFSPMIPGVTVGGFIPIEKPIDDKKENSDERAEFNEDDRYKEVQLVTKSMSAVRRTSTKSSTPGHIDKLGSSTISHLSTSISPILSTLVPKREVVTERASSEEQELEVISSEIEMPRNSNKFSIEQEIYNHENIESSSTRTIHTTTTQNEQIPAQNERSVIFSTTLIPDEVVDDYDIDSFNESSALSADLLIAPGTIINRDPPTKAPTLPPKAGKIQKVYTTPSPSASLQAQPRNHEVPKLIEPFIAQYSSESPTGFDNEFQPNQIYQQTSNKDQRHHNDDQQSSLPTQRASPYERNDMDWYFSSYNNTHQPQPNPVQNYNFHQDDGYDRSRASSKNGHGLMNSAIILIVIKLLVL